MCRLGLALLDLSCAVIWSQHGSSWIILLLSPTCAFSRETPLRRCTSLPLGLNLWDQSEEDINALPLTPEASPTSGLTFTWKTNNELDHMSLTPPPTPTSSPASGFGEAATESGGGWGLGRAVGWIRNIASEQTSKPKKTDDSMPSSVFK